MDGIADMLPSATIGSARGSFDDWGISVEGDAKEEFNAVGVVVVGAAVALFGMMEFVFDVDEDVTEAIGVTITWGSTNTLVMSNRNVTPNDDDSVLSFNNTISVVLFSCVLR